ncbi:hypothetical protein HGB24_02015 [Candidatus Saccharibacteria bacterium]|nr:hypothetical protein [Candidatus Saccharibacteria bacterium]
MKRLVEYFTCGIDSRTLGTVGAEVETQFVDSSGVAISTEVSQRILADLVRRGWSIEASRSNLITAIVDHQGNKMLYELGRHNIEVATVATLPQKIASITRDCLGQLHDSANRFGAYGHFAPIFNTDEDLLVVPDERDANWLKLDGRETLAPLARTSSVQFTLSIAPPDAINVINRLGKQIDCFLSDYPQEAIWRTYIARSHANYLAERYGGPCQFESIVDYCNQLARHDVVSGEKLIPLAAVDNLDVSLFLRSIWWYFRFKRYGSSLCVEVRPMPRLSDEKISDQLKMVVDIIG